LIKTLTSTVQRYPCQLYVLNTVTNAYVVSITISCCTRYVLEVQYIRPYIRTSSIMRLLV